MTFAPKIIPSAISKFDGLSREQDDLKDQLFRSILETDGAIDKLSPEMKQIATRLKAVALKRKEALDSFPVSASESTSSDIWAEFGEFILREVIAVLIRGLEVLLQPPQGFITVCNMIDEPVTALTYNQNDGVHIAEYKSYILHKHDVMVLEAKGADNIQVRIRGHKEFNRCPLSSSYVYNNNGILLQRTR